MLGRPDVDAEACRVQKRLESSLLSAAGGRRVPRPGLRSPVLARWLETPRWACRAALQGRLWAPALKTGLHSRVLAGWLEAPQSACRAALQSRCGRRV